jgi:uncharacterized protein
MTTVEKPFIHALRTPLCNYIYDVNTNAFVSVDEGAYQYLREAEQQGGALPDEADEHIEQCLEALWAQGYLSSKRPREIRHSQSDLLAYHLNENIAQMALQVTQQCNFRCAYCDYCASDFVSQRDHSAKRMSVETALSAVDFFAKRCANQDEPTIGFYGGEPLLEFPLIQRVTEYAEKKLYAKDLKFTVTTNASLLTPEIARFFAEHHFLLTISLDGTPETHDRSRRFAGNGKGSFEVIRRNLESLRQQWPDFEYSFNTVVDPRYPCDSLHELFTRDEFFGGAKIRSTLISDQFSIEKTVPGEVFLQQDSRHMYKSYLSFRDAYDRKKVSRVARESLSANFQRFKIEMKQAVSLMDVAAPGGPCIPGQMRLFVNADGILYPCERVSETSPAMKIGNLREGVDMGKVDRLLNIAQDTAEDCKNCWAFRHCKLCSGQSDNCGELSADLRRSQCESVREQVEDLFRDYLWTREFGISEDTWSKGV